MLNGDLFNEGDGHIKFGNVGICWGQVHPSYANANVLLAKANLPYTFTNGCAVATPINYGNIEPELDTNAKVKIASDGKSITIALHSAGSRYTDASTLFYAGYIVIGTIEE